MATYKVVKGSISGDAMLSEFTEALTGCVSFACGKISRDISKLDTTAYGSESTITKASTGLGGLGATSFAGTVVAPHANAYARHFLRLDKSATARMDLGNLVEQLTFTSLRDYYTDWTEGTHYLYQTSIAVPPGFPIKYTGTSKTARPDFRVPHGGGEAVFDITTPLEVGHLIDKQVDGTKLADHAKVLVAVEIIWEDKDLWGL
ncbi:hypothetical protein ACM64Y_03835 [Novispirillum sp. DQ9]|uniref:hypothetical protein n=1 Tax=Novispirillum sp. DQ9 TaxID=3398612 RepID=UPI003C7B2A63